MYRIISAEKPKKWNKTAVDCFLRHCNCKKCYINALYFEVNKIKCCMKYYVIEMFKLFGPPNIQKYYKLL